MSIKEGDLVKSSTGWSVVKRTADCLECCNITHGINILVTGNEVQEVVKEEDISHLENILTPKEKHSYACYVNNENNIENRHITIVPKDGEDHVHVGVTSESETCVAECNYKEDYNITYTCAGNYESLSINNHVLYSRENGRTEVNFNLHDKEDSLSLIEDIVPRIRKVNNEY